MKLFGHELIIQRSIAPLKQELKAVPLVKLSEEKEPSTLDKLLTQTSQDIKQRTVHAAGFKYKSKKNREGKAGISARSTVDIGVSGTADDYEEIEYTVKKE